MVDIEKAKLFAEDLKNLLERHGALPIYIEDCLKVVFKDDDPTIYSYSIDCQYEGHQHDPPKHIFNVKLVKYEVRI